VRLVLPDLHVELVTDRGVFAAERVDAGTKALLLDGPPLPQGAVDLVDLGAGYGPIAVTLARRAPGATVWAVEVNERARELCVENAAAAGVSKQVRVVAPDEVPADLQVAALWSNPPIRIGKRALHELLTQWLGRLARGGTAALVVQRHLGADSLARWLTQQGWQVARRASKGGYRLLDVKPRSTGPVGGRESST
jgi:16S rRNA (guanine1207-N2)-methyltransferase